MITRGASLSAGWACVRNVQTYGHRVIQRHRPDCDLLGSPVRGGEYRHEAHAYQSHLRATQDGAEVNDYEVDFLRHRQQVLAFLRHEICTAGACTSHLVGEEHMRASKRHVLAYSKPIPDMLPSSLKICGSAKSANTPALKSRIASSVAAPMMPCEIEEEIMTTL